MKVTDLIKVLESVLDKHGNIECLIEVNDDYTCSLVPVDEVSYEDREGFGPSVALLQ